MRVLRRNVLLFVLFVLFGWAAVSVLIFAFVSVNDPSDTGPSALTENRQKHRIETVLIDSEIKNASLLRRDADTNALVTMYSISCWQWQLMQAIVLDNTWLAVGQNGHLVRVVSGCRPPHRESDAKSKALWELMTRTPLPAAIGTDVVSLFDGDSDCADSSLPLLDASKRFHVLFVPTHSQVTAAMPCGGWAQLSDWQWLATENAQLRKYPQLNRIFALYLIFNVFDFTKRSGIPAKFVMTLDPDFIFLKAIDIKALFDEYSGGSMQQPIAGRYSLGSKWVPWYSQYRSSVNRSLSASLQQTLARESSRHFEAGVPYIWKVDQWSAFIPIWASLIPVAFGSYKGIESDMFAYMMAAVENGRRAENKDIKRHSLVDALQVTCMRGAQPPFDEGTVYFLHYCGAYSVRSEHAKDVFTFNKHWTKARRDQKWLFECQSPILKAAPKWSVAKEAKVAEFHASEWKSYRAAHTAVLRWNQALTVYKSKYCQPNGGNTRKSVVLHEATAQTNDLLFHSED